LVAELTADLKELKNRGGIESEAPVVELASPDALGEALEALPRLRKLIDQLAEATRPSRTELNPAVQNQVTSAATTMLNQTHALTGQLAVAMVDHARDGAARNQADVAAAAAEARVATADLEIAGLAAINQQTMNLDRFGLITELLQQQRLQLKIVQERADTAVRPSVLAAVNTDSQLQQWTTAMQRAVNNPNATIGDSTAYQRFMDERLALVQSVALVAAQEYRDGVEEGLRRSRIRLVIGLAAGLVILLGLGLGLWWRRRVSGSSHSGGETAAIVEVREPARSKVAVGAEDA
jgi:hypothetical protein